MADTAVEAEYLAQRELRFIDLGFGTMMSEVLAHSNVAMHDADDLLKAGCPVELAFEILRDN